MVSKHKTYPGGGEGVGCGGGVGGGGWGGTQRVRVVSQVGLLAIKFKAIVTRFGKGF